MDNATPDMNALITAEVVGKYLETMLPARRLLERDGKVIVENWGEGEIELFDMLHSTCGWAATVCMGGGQEICGLELSAEANPDTIKTISANFRKLDSKITRRAGEGLTNGEIARGFADFYHLILPTTESGRFVHELIEEAFKALELGEIPRPIPSAKAENPIANEGVASGMSSPPPSGDPDARAGRA